MPRDGGLPERPASAIRMAPACRAECPVMFSPESPATTAKSLKKETMSSLLAGSPPCLTTKGQLSESRFPDKSSPRSMAASFDAGSTLSIEHEGQMSAGQVHAKLQVSPKARLSALVAGSSHSVHFVSQSGPLDVT